MLTPARARDLARQSIAQSDESFIIWALLELRALANEAHDASGEAPTPSNVPDPSTPSGMIRPYLKPPGKKRKAKPGRKPGHEGARRRPPLHVDRQETHTLERVIWGTSMISSRQGKKEISRTARLKRIRLC